MIWFEIPLVSTCTPITIVKNTQAGVDLRAMFRIIVVVVPRAKIIL
jgi:hypothetical protein